MDYTETGKQKKKKSRGRPSSSNLRKNVIKLAPDLQLSLTPSKKKRYSIRTQHLGMLVIPRNLSLGLLFSLRTQHLGMLVIPRNLSLGLLFSLRTQPLGMLVILRNHSLGLLFSLRNQPLGMLVIPRNHSLGLLFSLRTQPRSESSMKTFIQHQPDT
jgi:hypothetical protein